MDSRRTASMYSETEGSGVHLQIIRRKATSSHYTLHVTHYYTCGQWVECCLSLQRDNDDEVHQDQNQEQIYYQEGFYTKEEFVLVNKVKALKTINNKQ